MLKTQNPVKTQSWKALQKHSDEIKKTHLSDLFSHDPHRFSKYSICLGEDFLLDYSKNLLTDETLKLLFSLARECDLSDGISKLFSGDKINHTENRSVQHTELRNRSGKNLLPEVQRMLEKMKSFSSKVAAGKMIGCKGQPITDVVNIGIGGSDLGPQMSYEALRPYHVNGIKVHFVSNLDGSHIYETLKKIRPETTLFIVVSKTFTTQETLTNAITARKWFLDSLVDESFIQQHFVAVTANVKEAKSFGIDAENCFEFWDWVGGRYSLCSSVGLSLACGIGFENFEKMLDGFYAMDKHFAEAEFEKNIPVLLALIGIWYGNFFGAQTEAIFPYDQYMSRFVSYLQQCNMESNGKSVDRNGNKIDYQTAPIIWGDVGTNGQHSFFQLLHQGTQLIPADFLAQSRSHNNLEEHHQKLLANFLAQTEALAFGNVKEHNFESEPFRHFFGNRPSNSIVYKKMTPFTLGLLIAMYEHKIFVQGVIWNIFSFDQWGVELGKKFAEKTLVEIQQGAVSYKHDSSTEGLLNYISAR